jgi:hypothetical protein
MSDAMDTAFYDSAIQFYDDSARARKVARLCERTFRMRSPAAPKVLRPKPGAGLGKLLSLEVMKPSGVLIVHQWTLDDAPNVFWSEELQAYYAWPGAKVERSSSMRLERIERLGLDRKARRASGRWNRRWGQPGATRRVESSVPTPRIRQQGAAIRIVYRSPFGKSDDWQHYHSPGPRVWVAGKEGDPPQVILVKGGKLKMTSRGLEH